MGMKFLYIPAGTFTMGSPDTEKGRQQFAEKQHTAKVKAFWLAETEVTQAQWKKVMNTNPSHFKGKDRPVEKVNWHDAHEFVRQLNDISKMLFRLPTEAEWEYAARAGTKTVRWGNGAGRNLANCNGCGSRWDYHETAPVKSFAPNPFGLYDIFGNAWEWTCSEYQWAYSESDDRCADQGEASIRGGSWFHQPRWMRAAHRRFSRPNFRIFFYGLRIARD